MKIKRKKRDVETLKEADVHANIIQQPLHLSSPVLHWPLLSYSALIFLCNTVSFHSLHSCFPTVLWLNETYTAAWNFKKEKTAVIPVILCEPASLGLGKALRLCGLIITEKSSQSKNNIMWCVTQRRICICSALILYASPLLGLCSSRPAPPVCRRPTTWWLRGALLLSGCLTLCSILFKYRASTT